MSAALLAAWDRLVRTHGRRRALVQAADGAVATFRELDVRATAWRARHLPDSLPVTRRPVVFAAPNGMGWLEIFLGLLKAGVVAVPVDASEPPASQRRLAAALRAAAWWDGATLEPLPKPKAYRDPAICLVKLTSGTTGNPRALAFTDDQLLADGRHIMGTMGFDESDLNYALIPLGHSYGLGNLAIPLLARGVSMVCGSAPLPHAIAADFARWRPTVFPGVPALWRALAASDVTLPSLRLAISAGAPLSPEVARDFAGRFGRRIHSFYGSSETGGIAYDRSGEGALAGHVGQAMRGVELTVGRRHTLRVSSAAVFTHGNRSRSGRQSAWVMPDRVTLDARGRLTLLGRRDTTVKVAGRRLNLGEVSDRLRRLGGVREVWVGISGASEGVLGAVVATDRTATELRTELLADTAPWKIPKKLVVVPALPITARGKMDTRAVQALAFGEAWARTAGPP